MHIFDTQVLSRPADAELRFLPEGPQQAGDEKISWVAIQHGPDERVGSLNVLDLASGQNTTHPLDGRPGFAFPTNLDNTFVIGLERRVILFNTKTKEESILCDGVDHDVENTIINDGVAFGGGLIFGTKHLEFSDQRAGLYLWRASDGRLIQLRADQICSNGKVVHQRDGGLWLLDIDSPTKTVVEYPLDVAGGWLGEPRVVVDLRDGEVFPDGMVLTPDGQHVIVAIYNPNDAEYGEARQFRLADGGLQAVWKTDGSPQVTCPLLIHRKGRVQLVLTTAVEHMPPDKAARYPNAGCLFVGDTMFDQVPHNPVFECP